jgi:hypothetical protein
VNAHQPLSEAGQAALSIAQNGWPVFPCDHRLDLPGRRRCKVPLTDHGFQDATIDTIQIESWWRQWPNALIGVPTGPRVGAWVLDLDLAPAKGLDGPAALACLEAEHGPVPDTVEARTPRGGRHLLFKWDPARPVTNSSGRLPSGIDVRGEGGYFIVWPSKREDGAAWSWEKPPGLFEPADAPEWLYSALLKKPEHKASRDEEIFGFRIKARREEAYAEAALDGAAREASRAPNGARNKTLNAVAYRLGRMIARGWLDRGEVQHGLLAAAYENGLVADDGEPAAEKTITSGIEAGLQRPHKDLENQDPVAHAEDGGGPWSDPDRSILEDRRGALPPFPLDAMPSFSEWLTRAAEGAGVTPGHIAVPLLSIASSMIGTARRVRASRSWSEPMTLWTALVGFSGTGKTPGIDVTTRAVAMVEQSRRTLIADMRRKHEAKAETAKAAAKKWKTEVQEAVEAGRRAPDMPVEATDPGPFVPPRLYVSDITVERLAVLLQARPRGLALVADELAGLFLNMSRYSNGSDREFWLQAWNGRAHVVERQGRPPVVLDHLLVGVTGGFQPDKLVKSFASDEDGMYARLLFGWPEETEYRPLSNDGDEIEPEFQNALARLANLPSEDEDGNFVSRAIWLSNEAIAEFEHFRQFLHTHKNAHEGREREWLAKGGGQVLRLAGTLAYLDWAMVGGAEPEQISVQFMTAAVSLWRDYFLPHSRAALRLIGLNDRQANCRKVLRWIKGHGKREVSLQDVRRDALGQRLDAEGTQALIGQLVRAGWLSETTANPDDAGRPARRWAVNPVLFT